MQQLNTLLVILLVLAVATGGYLVWKNQKLSTEITVLKNSDLAKEVENLTLKLDNAKRDLSAAQKEVSRLDSKNKTLEANLNKIRPYVDAIDAVQLVVLGTTGPTREVVAGVDPKVAALNDSEVSSRWAEAKRNVNFEQLSWQQNFFGITISTMVSKIFSFLP